jgi:carbonic anhydrase
MEERMTVADELMTANADYVAAFADGGLPMPPARHVAIVTCMDARIHPEQSLGLAVGDAHMIRNAGGRAEDAIRSLVISQRLLGTDEILVLHHTDCGMLTFSNADLAAKVTADLGVDVGGRDFLPFPDLEQSVRDDVALLSSSPLIADVPITGGIYDVNTGAVTVVK